MLTSQSRQPLVTDAPTPATVCGPDFSYAFQPIVDINAQSVFAYEALIRGKEGQAAHTILTKVPEADFFEFDQRARNTAIRMAADLGLKCKINLNISPASLQTDDRFLSRTVTTARNHNLSLNQIVIEITETECIDKPDEFINRINRFRAEGIRVAIDDFGAGYSGLNLIANFQPDIVKLDMQLIRGIEGDGPRQAIVRAISQLCDDLGIEIVAEGIETQAELKWLRSIDIEFFQGYLFARPGFQCLPQAAFPPTV